MFEDLWLILLQNRLRARSVHLEETRISVNLQQHTDNVLLQYRSLLLLVCVS